MHAVAVQFMTDLKGRMSAEYILEKRGLCQPNYRAITKEQLVDIKLNRLQWKIKDLCVRYS